MRNVFALIGVLVVVVGGVGWYLGWYKMNVTKNPEGNLQIQTNVDTKKLSGDSTEFFQKVEQMVGDKIQQTGQNGSTPPTTTPANTPGTTTPTTSPVQGNGLPTIPPLPNITPPAPPGERP